MPEHLRFGVDNVVFNRLAEACHGLTAQRLAILGFLHQHLHIGEGTPFEAAHARVLRVRRFQESQVRHPSGGNMWVVVVCQRFNFRTDSDGYADAGDGWR